MRAKTTDEIKASLEKRIAAGEKARENLATMRKKRERELIDLKRKLAQLEGKEGTLTPSQDKRRKEWLGAAYQALHEQIPAELKEAVNEWLRIHVKSDTDRVLMGLTPLKC